MFKLNVLSYHTLLYNAILACAGAGRVTAYNDYIRTGQEKSFPLIPGNIAAALVGLHGSEYP